MADLKRALEHEGERFDLPSGALERMLDRQQRRQQRQRVATVVVALAITVGVAVLVGSLHGLGGGATPIPGASPTIAVPSLDGTWRSSRLDRAQTVAAFVAAGGTRAEGRGFFAQLGNGSKDYAVITLRFAGARFVEFESGDGGPPVVGYEATARVAPDATLTLSSPRCTGTYSSSVSGTGLRLHVIAQCDRHDGPYNTTLFASFPLRRVG